MGKLRLFGLVVIVALVPGSILLQRAIGTNEGRDPLAEGPAPEFTLRSLAGEPVSLGDFRGDPVVVHFWGSWCEPCDFQFELLVAAREKFADVRFVGILFRDDPGAARRYAQRRGADWPMLIDPDEEAAAAYGVEGTPLTFFVDRGGRIRGSMIGEYSRPLLEDQLARIL